MQVRTRAPWSGGCGVERDAAWRTVLSVWAVADCAGACAADAVRLRSAQWLWKWMPIRACVLHQPRPSLTLCCPPAPPQAADGGA
jgi:hypothetical protein